ncbi:MAG: radical SAM protein [Candidatus Methanomethylicia archaeon]
MPDIDTIGYIGGLSKLSNIRFILKYLTGRCLRDKERRVEVALQLYTNTRSNACFTCKHIVYPVISKIIKRGAESFGVPEWKMKEKFKDPYWRRGLACVLIGVAKYGIQRPFTPGVPFLIVWDYTYACNLKCKHCYSSAGKPLKDEMGRKEALKVVSILGDIGVPSVAFSGGEPLVRNDIFDVLKLCKEYRIFTAIATNGTTLTRENVEKLKSSGVGYLQISLDGVSPKTHDSFRGINGVFNRVIEGIKNAVESGIFVEVATTVTKLNIHEISDIIDLCRRLKVNWFMAYNFIPTGRGREVVNLDLSPSEREELLKNLWIEALKGGLTVLTTAPQFARVALINSKNINEAIVPTHFYSMKLPGKLAELSEFVGGCGAGRSYCAIEPDGTIQPCVFLPVRVGNILIDNFEYLWDNSELLIKLRNKDLLKGNCGVCKYRYVCGGCRARAYAYFNDYMAPDPGCIYNAQYIPELKTRIYSK